MHVPSLAGYRVTRYRRHRIVTDRLSSCGSPGSTTRVEGVASFAALVNALTPGRLEVGVRRRPFAQLATSLPGGQLLSVVGRVGVLRSFRLSEPVRCRTMFGMVISADEDRLIGQVVDRLCARFPHVPSGTVYEIVGSVRHRFDEAPIRDFVPLFVERHTKETLAHLASPHPVPSGAHRG